MTKQCTAPLLIASLVSIVGKKRMLPTMNAAQPTTASAHTWTPECARKARAAAACSTLEGGTRVGFKRPSAPPLWVLSLVSEEAAASSATHTLRIARAGGTKNANDLQDDRRTNKEKKPGRGGLSVGV